MPRAGGQGDDTGRRQCQQAAENKADMMEEQAGNATTEGQEDALEQNAETAREAGEEKDEAIDDADVVVNQQ